MSIDSKKKKRNWLILVSAVLVILIVAGTVLQSFIGSAIMEHTTAADWKSMAYRQQDYDSADPGRFSADAPVCAGYVQTAETEQLILYVREDNRAIKLYSKETSSWWDSVVTEDEINRLQVGEYYSYPMQSLFTFDFIDLSNLNVDEQSATLIEQETEIHTEKIRNGIRIMYRFPSLSLGLSVEFTLVGDELHCRIPDKGIKENTDKIKEIEKVKSKIQGKISAFQKQTEAFQKALEKENMDPIELDMVRIYVNEIYNLLVEIKETTGTQNFDSDKLTTVQEDIDSIAMLLEGRESLAKGLQEMQSRVDEIVKDTGFLSENQVMGITNLKFMPYFGSGTKQDKGYVFYPDRNGAISYFDVTHPDSGGGFEKDVYDVFAPVPGRDSKIKDKESTDRKEKTACLYPVYGIKKESSAMTAVIVEGEHDCAITYNPITTACYRTSAYPTLHLRKSTVYMNDDGGTSVHYDKMRTAHDWGMVYKFQSGDKANYAGMALAYRDMLVENGRLKRSDWMNGEMPLAASFFMGVQSRRDTLSRSYITFTQWKDVADFLREMEKNGISRQLVNIEYWTKGAGKNSFDRPVPAKELGSKAELEALMALAKPGQTLLSLDWYSLSANRRDLSFLVSNNATVKSINSLAVEQYGWNLLNPFYVYNQHRDNLKKLSSYGNNGITYADLSAHLYYDYNSKGKMDKAQTGAIFKQMVAESKKQIPYAVIPKASSLYFDTADWITDISHEGSGYMFTDESVPFYQMVVRGYIPYTSEALNEVSDTEYSRLKRIEYGELPFYALTKKLPPEKKSEYISGLYSSEIDKWSSAVIKDYQQYKKDFGDSWNLRMTCHEKLQEQVYCTTFENDSSVIVNYNDHPVTVAGVTVGAKDYAKREAQ